MMTTRRLLAMASADVRPLYKHVVLLCKIILGADSVTGHHPDDVLEKFGRLHPEARCVCPCLADLVGRPTDPAAAAQVTEAADALLAYLDRLDRMGERRCR